MNLHVCEFKPCFSSLRACGTFDVIFPTKLIYVYYTVVPQNKKKANVIHHQKRCNVKWKIRFEHEQRHLVGWSWYGLIIIWDYDNVNYDNTEKKFPVVRQFGCRCLFSLSFLFGFLSRWLYIEIQIVNNGITKRLRTFGFSFSRKNMTDAIKLVCIYDFSLRHENRKRISPAKRATRTREMAGTINH